MLEQFKILLGKEVADNVANVYINRATKTILTLTKRTLEDVQLLQDVIVDLAIYRYNMQSIEHLKSENFDGASFNYNTDIPEFLKAEIESLKVRKLVVL